MADAGPGSKRIAVLTGYILALLVAAGSIGLYRLDAESYREDAQALLQLQRLDRHLAGRDPEAERLPLRQAADRMLSREHPALHAEMIAARVTLTRHLVLGLHGEAPVTCADFGERVFEGKVANINRPAEVPFSLLAIETPWLAQAPDHGIAERGTVAQLLDRLADAQKPVRLRIARGLDLLPVATDPCASFDDGRQLSTQQTVAGVIFQGAEMDGDMLVARFEGMDPAGQHVQRALIPERRWVSIAADVVEVEGPPAARLLVAMGEPRLSADLDLLWSRPDALARLRADYGFLPIDYAVSTAGAALVQGYAGATVLGLRVTPRRLSLVVAAVALGLAAAIALEARAAARAGRPLREPAPEGPRAALLASHVGRALLWSVTPAAAILLASPLKLTWLIAAALAAAIGAAAVALAARADHRGGG